MKQETHSTLIVILIALVEWWQKNKRNAWDVPTPLQRALAFCTPDNVLGRELDVQAIDFNEEDYSHSSCALRISITTHLPVES
jgi:hypothetical protein